MNLKWKKKYLGPILGLVGAAVLIGGVYLYSSSNIQPDHQKEFNQTSKKVTKPKEKAIDLSGDYVSNERDEAKIEKKGKTWKIDYQTADGKVSAEFSTDWKVEGSNKVSTGKMKKSDGNTDFTVTVRVFKYKTDKKPLITVTMSDKNPDHEMVFANREDFFKSTDPNDVVLDGNLSPFEGAYSNDTYEKEIQAGIKAMDKNQCYQTTDKFCSLVSRMGGASASQVMVYMLRYVNAILVTAMEAHVKLEEIYPQGLRKLYAEILEALEPSRERRYIKANIMAARDELMNQKAYSILQDIENLIASKKGNITLTECADILGVHPTYIWKVLKMEKGKSFTDCLEEYKIEEAKHLLLNSSLSVAEIAAELNYTNAQNFIRFFSKSTGVTPGKFRKLY